MKRNQIVNQQTGFCYSDVGFPVKGQLQPRDRLKTSSAEKTVGSYFADFFNRLNFVIIFLKGTKDHI